MNCRPLFTLPGLRRTYRRLAFRIGASIAKVAVARQPAIRLYMMLKDKIDDAEFGRRGSHAGMLGEVAPIPHGRDKMSSSADLNFR